MLGNHIFLSYRSVEEKFALRLAKDLRQGGFSIWVDQLQGILPSDDWIQKLQDSIDQSLAVIPVLSPAYVKAKYCRLELQRAVRLNLPVLPVLLHALTPRDWPIEIESSHYVDFQKWNDPVKYADSLKKLIEDGLMAKLGLSPDTKLIADVAATPDITHEQLLRHKRFEQKAETSKWFNDARGFGFITSDEVGEDRFVDHTVITAERFRTLIEEGSKVDFDVRRGPKELQARNVKLV